MRPRTNFQLARIFGIRIGVSASWFFVLFFLIYWLSRDYFPQVLGQSSSTDYVVAVAAALGYFASLILHELGHALVARRLGIGVVGIDLWAFGGLSHMRREPASAGEELKIAIAGPAVTLVLFGLCLLAIVLLASGNSVSDVALSRESIRTTPALALLGWLAFVNAALFLFNVVPAFPLDGGRIARALVWWRTGDRNRATQATGRSGQAFALLVGLFGLWLFASNEPFVGLLTMLLAFMLYQAAGAAALQGALGRRIQNITVADIMDREPVTIAADVTLLDAQEQFFLRYRWPWFPVVDAAHRALIGLALWRKQDRKSRLAEAAPGILEQVCLDQNTDRALKLQIVLDDVGLARSSRHIAGFAFFPKHGTKQMIAANFDVGRNDGGGAATE